MGEIRVPDVVLNDGVRMPQVGFGVFKVEPGALAGPLREAFSAGYRSIDTAAMYGNEADVGAAVRESGIARDELFVTTKLWNDSQGFEAAQQGCRESLERLGMDRLDLFLIHWPAPRQDLYVETWRAFEGLRDQGLVTSIGVSNFQVAHLRRLAEETATVPAVNQVELHPYLQQAELREYHAAHGIVTEAWGPLGQGKSGLLADPVVTGLAEKHGKSPAQVVLRWHVQLGNVVIPKSVTASRIVENIDVFDFALDDGDMDAIASLDQGRRGGPDPDTFG